MKITEAECLEILLQSIVEVVCRRYEGTEYGTTAKLVSKLLGLPQGVSSALLRQSRDEGYLYFTTLIDDEGRMVGSGYLPTLKGQEMYANRVFEGISYDGE